MLRFSLPSLPKEIQPLQFRMFTFSLLCFRTDVPGVKCLGESKVAIHTCVGGKVEIQTQDLGVKERRDRVSEKRSVWTRVANFVYSFVPFVSVPVLIMI